MRRAHILVAVAIFILCSGSIMSRESGVVGAFYGGWGTNKGDYIWLEGHGSKGAVPLLADVDGDDRADAVTFEGGTWSVALAGPGREFGAPTAWRSSFGEEAVAVLAGDVNGDGLADAVAVERSSSGGYIWKFASARERSFARPHLWMSAFGEQGESVVLGDVTGDGRADAVAVDRKRGLWRVATSRRGPGAAAEGAWIRGMAPGYAKCFVADVTGDGAADAVAYDERGGTWTVAPSNGEDGFYEQSVWGQDFGGDEVRVGDVNGDGCADAVAFDRASGDWRYAASNGQDGFGKPKSWKRGHGGRSPRACKGLPPASHVLLGDCCEDATSPVAFFDERGQWRVLPADRWSSPWWDVNSWEATTGDQFLPWIDGRYYGYDAAEDRFAVDFLVEQAAKARIDYIIYDQTNPWGALVETYHAFSRAMADWNSVPCHRRVRYAFAIGFKHPEHPEAVERQAKKVYEDFLVNPAYGGPSAYQEWNGKPLLIIYIGGNRKGPRIWENYDGKTEYADRFTIRWMAGTIRRETVPACLKNGDIYGWLMYDGSLPSKEQMVVQPGFYNGNKFRSRSYRGIEGDWYRRCNWDRVLRHRPRAVTIIGYTGDLEQVNVYIHDADTARGMGKTETWAKDAMYWQMTKDYIEVYRRLLDGDLEPIAQYGCTTVQGGAAEVQLELPAEKPPVVLMCVVGSEKNSPAIAHVEGVTVDGFRLRLQGSIDGATVAWMAVRRGHWYTSDGAPLDAGVADVKRPAGGRASLAFNGRFELRPVVLYQRMGSGSAICGTTDSAHTFRSGFSPRVGSSGSGGDRLAWVAIGEREQRMWTGREYTASRLTAVPVEGGRTFRFPFTFCDRPVLLAGFAGTAGGPERSGPYLTSLDRQGATVKGGGRVVGSMTAFALDGGGGTLYGAEAGQ